MMRRFAQVALMGMLVLAVASVATAQQTPQPVVRLGNWIEVGNDVFMHIIGTADIRIREVSNLDFDGAVRDRANARSTNCTPCNESDSQQWWAELRLGGEFRYQKNLTLYLLFEHQQGFDGNTIDDTSNGVNPGGTSVFGQAAAGETPGFHIERYWIDYKFAGTPFRMRVGADLWVQDQAGLVGDDDPRLAFFGEFGDFDAMAAVVMQSSAQRLGLEGDNNFFYYTFSAGYNLKPHRFQFDVTYFRDRFAGADRSLAQTLGQQGITGTNIGYQGQKTDSVLLMASWTGTAGPIRGLLQGNILTGTSRGGTIAGVNGLPPGAPVGRHYNIFAGAVVAYAEADFGIVRPFVGFIFGSGDGDATDKKLHGFMTLPQTEITQITGTPLFAQLETSNAFALRDYSCPSRSQGERTGGTAANPLAIGSAVLGANGATTQCSHSTGNPFNDRIGITSHLGLSSTYSNPGTIVFPVGARVFPVKGHEITAWYVQRRMVSSGLVNTAFIAGVDGGGQFNGRIAKTLEHEVGGFWQWTLNPYFDIRLSGNLAFAGEGYKDLSHLSNCNPGGAFVACNANDVAIEGEARFRARF